MDPPVNTSTSTSPPPESLPIIPTESLIFLNIPISTKLNRTNYLTWKSQIEPILYGYGLHRFLTSTPPSPNITINGQSCSNPDHKQDQILLGWLRSSLSETILGELVSCTSSSALWSNLQQSFSASSRARLAELRRNLQTTVKGGLSCTDYLQRIRAIADELSFAGSPIPDDDIILYILGGLGPEFNSFVAAATTKDNLSLLELQLRLLSFESLIQSQHISSSSNPTALSVSHSRPKSNNPRPYSYRPAGSPSHQNGGPRPRGPRPSGNKPPYTSPGGFRPHNPTGPQLSLLPTPSYPRAAQPRAPLAPN